MVQRSSVGACSRFADNELYFCPIHESYDTPPDSLTPGAVALGRWIDEVSDRASQGAESILSWFLFAHSDRQSRRPVHWQRAGTGSSTTELLWRHSASAVCPPFVNERSLIPPPLLHYPSILCRRKSNSAYTLLTPYICNLDFHAS